MNSSNKQVLSNTLLVIILFLGSFLRFYRLGETPAGLHVDEASLGYNAYSVLKTGRDEFGKSFPIFFRSFATYQSPVYTYLSIPIVSLIGLSPFSTRFLSALLGSLTLPVFYFLVKKLNQNPRSTIYNLPTIATLLLAISPWHILYSRTAYETNIALFFLLLGVLLFYLALEKSWLFLLSGLSLVISMYAYRAEIVITPVLVLVLLYTSRKQIREHILYLLLTFFLCFVLTIPLISIIKTPGFNARSGSLNIFGKTTQVPWRDPLQEFSSLYSSYFSPRFLFSLGDSGPRKPFPDIATFYNWQFPLYLLGVYFFLKRNDWGKLKPVVLVLLLVSPIPAALTRDPYSTLRSLPMVIPLTVIMAYGAVWLFSQIRHFRLFKHLLFVLILSLSVIKLYISIFYHHDFYRLIYWDYGWEETVKEIPKLDQSLPIIVDNTHRHPYIFLLFFLKYDPQKYQQDNSQVSQSLYYQDLGLFPNKTLGKIFVRPFVWGKDTDETEQYLVTTDVALSEAQIKLHPMSIIKEVKYPDGSVALRIVKVNPRKK